MQLITGLALLLGPTVGMSQWGQPGGFGGQPGGFGGRGGGGGSRDPNDRWNQYTGGKPVWKRSEITDPNLLSRFDRTAQMVGATNGEITKEQYLTAMQRFMPGGGPPAPGQAAPASPGAPSPGGWGGRGGGFGGGWNVDAIAEAAFRRMDTNGDGLLNYDEMDDTLKAERDKWDTNKDGFIDLNEFKEYMRARMQQSQARGGGWGGAGGLLPPAITPDETDKRPTVYRAGKLPPNLPAWFAQYDTDHDGQIGLYEWKAAGQPIEQFLEMDRNGDGFLTVEEVMRTVPAAPGGSASPGAGPGNGASSGTPAAVAPGGWQGNGPGQGGWPGGGRGRWGGRGQ